MDKVDTPYIRSISVEYYYVGIVRAQGSFRAAPPGTIWSGSPMRGNGDLPNVSISLTRGPRENMLHCLHSSLDHVAKSALFFYLNHQAILACKDECVNKQEYQSVSEQSSRLLRTVRP